MPWSEKLPDDPQMTFSVHMQTSPTTAVSLEYTEKQKKGLSKQTGCSYWHNAGGENRAGEEMKGKDRKETGDE